MVENNMIMRFAADVERSSYRISVLDGKVDSLMIIDLDAKRKANFYRFDINKELFERAMYLSAKHFPENFKEIYMKLKKSDPEFFEIAEKVLRKIKTEYDFQ